MNKRTLVSYREAAATPVADNYDPMEHGALCEACPLADTGIGPIAGAGDMKSTYIIVGESPGREEVRQETPFIGRSGVLLSKLLRNAGVKRSAVYCTNALLCMPPGGKLQRYRAELRRQNAQEKREAKKVGRAPALWRDPLDCCRPRLLREIARFEKNETAQKRLVVVTAGAAAMLALTGKKSLLRRRGSPVWVDLASEPA